MTVKELLAEVCALGFGEAVYLNVQTASAINRSLRRIFSDRKITREHSFEVYGKIPASRISHILHKAGECESRTVNGDAFSITAHGNGTLTVVQNGTEELIGFRGKSTRITRRLSGSATLLFGGDEANYYTDLVTFKGELSISDGIHDGSPEIKYSAKDMLPDFHSFVGTPTNGEGTPLLRIRLVGDSILVPYDYSGRISFLYLSAPAEITVADEDAELDIPEECKEALPLLVASYVYLGCDPHLAEKYSELYREAVTRAPEPRGISYRSSYRITDGWA